MTNDLYAAAGGGPLSRRQLVGGGLLVAAVGLTACAGGPEQPAFYDDLGSPGAKLDTASAQGLINGYRSNHGLGPVEIDPTLTAVAQELASAMAASDEVRLSLDRERALDKRLSAAGFDATTAVQNVSAGYRRMSEAFSGWRDSPPHDANMKAADVTRMGIATAYSGASKYKVFWTLVLAAPAA